MCGRALVLLKALAAEGGGAVVGRDGEPVRLDADRRTALARAATPADAWTAVGEDFWVAVPVEGSKAGTAALEGTRLTVVRIPPPEGEEEMAGGSSDVPPDRPPVRVEFSIRTPVTRERWSAFDRELTQRWETCLDALAAVETCRADPHARRAAADASLRLVFYWYHFMPLARGTAAVGLALARALLLAARIPAERPARRGEQPDWDAILSRSPDAFVRTVGDAWLLCPPLHQAPDELDDPLESLPRVADVFDTGRSRVKALAGAFEGRARGDRRR